MKTVRVLVVGLLAVAALAAGCGESGGGGGVPTAVLGGGAGATAAANPPVANTPAATAEVPANPSTSNPGGSTYPSGDLRVPEDIAPGLYRAEGGEFCTWSRLAGFSGAASDTRMAQVSNGGPEIVEIMDSDAGFTSQRCGDWAPLDLGALQSRATVGDGVHVVGVEMEPGNWLADTPTDLCLWQRLSGFSGAPADIIAIGLGDGRTVVQIASTDTGFRSFGCGEWKRG